MSIPARFEVAGEVSMAVPDYYKVLGISPRASSSAVKLAYHELARSTHPDLAGPDPAMEARFKDAAQGYRILSNVTLRKSYDRQRREGAKMERAAIGAMRKAPPGLIVLAGSAAVLGLGLVLLLRRPPGLPAKARTGGTPAKPNPGSSNGPATTPAAAPAASPHPDSRILLQAPTVDAAVASDIEGQQRNYKVGYGLGIGYRAGFSGPLKTPSPDPGLAPYMDQGFADGQVARRPQYADPDLFALWNAAKDQPAWDWSQGPLAVS